MGPRNTDTLAPADLALPGVPDRGVGTPRGLVVLLPGLDASRAERGGARVGRCCFALLAPMAVAWRQIELRISCNCALLAQSDPQIFLDRSDRRVSNRCPLHVLRGDLLLLRSMTGGLY